MKLRKLTASPIQVGSKVHCLSVLSVWQQVYPISVELVGSVGSVKCCYADVLVGWLSVCKENY